MQGEAGRRRVSGERLVEEKRMSRIGKKPIPVPDRVDVKLSDRTLTVKGPVGELSLTIRPEVKVEHNAKERIIRVLPTAETKRNKAMWGLFRALIANMVQGVSEGFSRRLLIQGTGYSAKMEKDKLVLQVGYAHPVYMEVPDGVTVKVPSTQIIDVSGADKQKVHQFCAEVRKVRPPNPYTAKGIRYADEEVKKKPGKTFVSGG